LVFKSCSLWIRHPIIYLTIGCALATRLLVSFLGYLLALVETHQLPPRASGAPLRATTSIDPIHEGGENRNRAVDGQGLRLGRDTEVAEDHWSQCGRHYIALFLLLTNHEDAAGYFRCDEICCSSKYVEGHALRSAQLNLISLRFIHMFSESMNF
jgi:hypothetical protein